MKLKYYDNYIMNISKQPNESWRELQQAVVSSYYSNTTIKKTILEEKIPFNQEYHSIEAWVGTVTDSATNTEKDANDYRALYFENCNHDVGRGVYYQYDNNYWLVYDSSTELESISNVKIRRCNNKLKWIDKENGQLIEYPCILDYTLSATQPSVTSEITSIGGRITIIVQGNKNTHKIKKNTRFLFNGTPYKFNNYNNFMQSDYITNDVPLLFMDCTVDTIQPNDDLENNIADSSEYKYSIKILEESFSQVSGFKGKLNAEVSLNGQKIDKNVVWKTDNKNIVDIDNQGNYMLVGNQDQECEVYAYIENSLIYDKIIIKIKADITTDKTTDIIIDPLITELIQYDNVVISANLYVDGVKQPDIVTCTPSGLTEDYYILINRGNNKFELANKKYSEDTPLTLTFSCGEYEESIDITFVPMF